MNEFVERCLREWSRLGVPAPLAEEMATDLASDLEEARAEGLSAEQYLGSSASDPASFAATWAAERGIIPAPSGHGNGRRRPVVLVAFTLLAAIVLVVATLLLATGEPKVTLTAKATPHLSTPGAHLSLPPSHRVQASAAAPVEWILLFVAVAGLGFSVWLWLRWGRSRLPAAPA